MQDSACDGKLRPTGQEDCIVKACVPQARWRKGEWTKVSMHSSIAQVFSGLQSNAQANPYLLWCCFTTLSVWLKSSRLFINQLKQNRTNCDLFECVFPRFFPPSYKMVIMSESIGFDLEFLVESHFDTTV